MSTKTQTKVIEREFDKKYINPHMRLHLEEQGWKYLGMRNGKPFFKIIY